VRKATNNLIIYVLKIQKMLLGHDDDGERMVLFGESIL